MRYTYKTNGTCSSKIEFDIEGNRITNVSFTGGCNGSLKAIATLVDGWTVEQITGKCSGILCGGRRTSCADQLLCAVTRAVSEAGSAK